MRNASINTTQVPHDNIPDVMEKVVWVEKAWRNDQDNQIFVGFLPIKTRTTITTTITTTVRPTIKTGDKCGQLQD